MARESALVSFRNDPANAGAASLAGSGFFVAKCWILTAKHVVDGSKDLWVRAQTEGLKAYPVLDRRLNNELDVALVKIEKMPLGATLLPLMSVKESELLETKFPFAVDMLGYHDELFETPNGIQVLDFGATKRHYVLGDKQPKGHSGGALCVGDKAWGMPVRHYIDPNTPRGCAIALYQVWEWLKEQLPEENIVEPGDSTLTEWNAWVARSRADMTSAFRFPVFDKLQQVFSPTDSGLPLALVKVLESPNRNEVGVKSIRVLESLLTNLSEASVCLSEHERTAVGQSFRKALDAAIRLCLDPGKLLALGIDLNEPPKTFLTVPANFPAGAAPAWRHSPSKCLCVENESGLSMVKDRHAHELPIELGEGEDRKRALTRAAAMHLGDPAKIPEQVDEQLCRKVRINAKRQADKGEHPAFVLPAQSDEAMGLELGKWVFDTVGFNTLILNAAGSADASPFLYDEETFLSKILGVLESLQSLERNAS